MTQPSSGTTARVPTRALGRARARSLAYALACAAAVLPSSLAAQAREEQPHGFDSAEGRLLGFYTASLLFTALGLAAPGPPTRVAFGVELGYVPRLSDEQRAIGTDKPENTNLAPVFPRPRISLGLPGGAVLEAAWLPPVKVFGVTANLVNAALSAPLGTLGGARFRARVGAPWGTVKGSITCSSVVAADGDAALRFYYDAICYGNDSEDELQPRHVSVEVVGTGSRARPLLRGTWAPWAALGARREWSRFDIGVLREDGSRDRDHPILVLRGTRAHGSLGLGWAGPRGATFAGELLYAPGSLATARVYAGLRR